MILVGQYDSPYVRRVAISLGLLELPFTRNTMSVFSDAEAMRDINPLGRIPSLILDDGEVLIATEATDRPTGRGAIADKIRSGREKLSSQAADKTRGLVGQGLGRSAEALANVGKLVGDTADGLDERLGPEYGDYARRAATAIEDTANSLAGKDADELIDDTREFVRKSPGVALAGAAVLGFALVRLVKSGLDQTSTKGKSKKG
jgi:glutathione S-transferase